MKFATRSLLVFSLSILPVFHSAATTLTYSSYSTWVANTTGSTELDFSSINLTSANYSNANGKTLTPANNLALPFVFTGPYSGGYQLTGNDYGTRNIISLFGPTGGRGNITITLPSSGENAILLGLGSTGSATSLSVSLSDGETFSVPATSGNLEFLGLSLSHNISWLTISTTTQPVINDFYFANSKLAQDVTTQTGTDGTADTPECATLLLIGTGLASLIKFRRFLPLKLAA